MRSEKNMPQVVRGSAFEAIRAAILSPIAWSSATYAAMRDLQLGMDAADPRDVRDPGDCHGSHDGLRLLHPQGARYAHGAVFPAGVAHLVVARDYGETVWFGLEGFKAGVRAGWQVILKHFAKQQRLEAAALDDADDDDDDDDDDDALAKVEVDRMLEGMRTHRAQEQARIATLPLAEQVRLQAEAQAHQERWEAQERARKTRPFFGDFLITDAISRLSYEMPGTWIFRRDVPGLISVPEHLSMCLADKLPVSDRLLDVLAELVAFQDAMGMTGCVWRPACSTGPQDLEWGEYVRFTTTLADIATREAVVRAKRYDNDVEVPAFTLKEAIQQQTLKSVRVRVQVQAKPKPNAKPKAKTKKVGAKIKPKRTTK